MVFNLSEKIGNMVNETGNIHQAITTINVKEFINLLLTPNNISKGFVEVSTIRYYAGDELI